MELTIFIEELLGIKLKEYQKIAIKNFESNEVNKLTRYTILNSYREFEGDGLTGSFEEYHRVLDNVSKEEFVVHNSKIGKYKY